MEKTTNAVKEKDLLKKVQSLVAEKRRKVASESATVRAFNERQGKVAAPFHEQLFNSALGAAGIDVAVLTKRHEKERASAVGFLELQRHAAIELAEATLEQHRLDSERRGDRLAHMHQGNPAMVIDVLKSAIDIEIIGRQGSSSIAAGKNIAKTKVELWGWVSALKGDLRGDLAYVDWKFVWTPPRTGFLNVISFLSLNGWGAVYPGPGCVKGSAGWTLKAAITLAQADSNGEMVTDTIESQIAGDQFGSSDMPSYGGIILGSRRLDDMPVITYPNQFVALPGEPLLITITAMLYLTVAHGEGELNFMDNDLQLNVPSVHLFLT